LSSPFLRGDSTVGKTLRTGIGKPAGLRHGSPAMR
jgi:hypothetical protein